MLNPRDVAAFLSRIRDLFQVEPEAEITLEANPEDLGPAWLAGIREAGVNRLSIGIQSFRDKDLVLMNRRHDAARALASVREARKQGFENLSVDLIYGIPGLDTEAWKSNLAVFLELEIPHLSAYHLGIEKGTVFYRMREQGRFSEIDEETSLEQFREMNRTLKEAGYLHYEISSFARPGRYSRHNSLYWEGKTYLGIGPSAHSFNGSERRWNVSNNLKYMEAIEQGTIPYEHEMITASMRFNEMIMTGLRTSRGLDPAELEAATGIRIPGSFQRAVEKYTAEGRMIYADDLLKLTEEGMFISDRIISDLFL